MVSFKVLHQSKKTRARTGRITTPHGIIYTPAFVPVATQAALKGVSPRLANEAGVQVMFVNTYHLWLRPGEDVVARVGGVHQFMGWSRPLMSDSGGFQVFSLGFGREHGVGKIASIFPDETGAPVKSSRETASVGQKPKLFKIDTDGATFTSHLDGATLRLTPQKSIEIQEKLGVDIILAFDECTSPLNTYEYTKAAMQRTHGWAKICLESKTRDDQALFGIVQGGQWQDLREESASLIGGLPFEGVAIGGSLGKDKADMHQVLDWTVPLLPPGKPRHLLGIGEVADIFEGVKRGVDSFDCVMPTRLARNGVTLARETGNKQQEAGSKKQEPGNRNDFRLNISNTEFRTDINPIEEGCQCYTCQTFSRAYLNHLLRANEMLGPQLLSIHNLFFMENLMKEVRDAIEQGRLHLLERKYLCQE